MPGRAEHGPGLCHGSGDEPPDGESRPTMSTPQRWRRSSRRAGYRRSVLLAVLLLAAACDLGQTEPEGPPDPVCAAGQIDGEVILLGRPDQMSPVAIDQFERRYGVDVVELFYESEDDLLSRVTAGADAFDVVLLTDYQAEVLWRGRQLFPLDPIALPGRVNLDPKFVHPPDSPDDPDVFYSIPLVWGTVGIGLNVNVVGEDAEPSWGLVFDTYRAWIYAGRVSLLGEGRQVLAAAMLYLGYSPNVADRIPVREAVELVANARAHLRGFESERYALDLVEGVLDVAHGRSDAFVEALPRDSGDFRYVIPQEGAIIWVDSMAVPITSRHPCSAHSFIDLVLEPGMGAEVANYAGVATPNTAAGEYVLPELAANPGIYPPAEVRDRLEILIYTEEIDRLYAEEFIHLDPS